MYSVVLVFMFVVDLPMFEMYLHATRSRSTAVVQLYSCSRSVIQQWVLVYWCVHDRVEDFCARCSWRQTMVHIMHVPTRCSRYLTINFIQAPVGQPECWTGFWDVFSCLGSDRIMRQLNMYATLFLPVYRCTHGTLHVRNATVSLA